MEPLHAIGPVACNCSGADMDGFDLMDAATEILDHAHF